jgi:predicted exporter
VENVAALHNIAKSLGEVAAENDSPGAAAARRLADDVDRLSDGALHFRQKAEAVFVTPLKIDLLGLRRALGAQRVTASSLPHDLAREWTAPDGRVRVEVVAKDGPNDSRLLRQFALSVLAVQPAATGQAIETYGWGHTIMVAFVQAGAWALFAVAILLWLTLRRIGDVLLTIIPLMVAAVLTLEICALADFPLNYANIIALPVLLGIGVAFKIYYVMAWRHGEYNFLESPLTHAVFFSALITATAFGSLWSSKNPGISSMGKLLALSLLCTLASAALFQPALMGRPREGNTPAGRPPTPKEE